MKSTIGNSIFLSSQQIAIITQLAAGYNKKEIKSNLGTGGKKIKSLLKDALASTGSSSKEKLIALASKEGLIERTSSWSNDLRLPPANPFLAKGYSSTMHANAASSDATINSGPGTSGNYNFVSQSGNGYATPTILMDSKGALLAVGVSDNLKTLPTVLLLNPRTLEIIDSVALTSPSKGQGHVAGGIYSYIDHDNNLVLVNANGQMQWYSNDFDAATSQGSLSLEKSVTIGQPGVVGTVPDYKGNIWYATQQQSPYLAGVGFYNQKRGNSTFYELPDGETVANSISSSPYGVAVASTEALYLFRSTSSGPKMIWRQPYTNSGSRKPGQLSAGTGSSPTFFGPKTGFEYVTIADNSAPTESINVYKTRNGKLVSSLPFLEGGVNSGTENSSIGIGSSIFTPSTYGYWYPPSSEKPKQSSPSSADFAGGAQLAGLSQKSLNQSWTSSIVSAALPRLSVPDGLIYTISGDYGSKLGVNNVQYYLSAIDAETGDVVLNYKLNGQYDQYVGQPKTKVRGSYTHNPLQMVGTMDQHRTLYQGQANGLFSVSGPSPRYGIGITSDGFSFSSADSYDGDGYVYSYNALNSADTSDWQGPRLAIQGNGDNNNNFTWANGQTILVDGRKDNTLTIFGSAVNGSLEGVDLEISYSDGSSATWTQSFSDWCDPKYYSGEAIYSQQLYRNTSSGGTDSTTNNIYAYQYNLEAGKQVESITLPFEYNLRILDIKTTSMYQVDLPQNTFGITTPPWQVANHQGFDGKGNYYSSFTIAGNASGSTAQQNNNIESYMPLSWNGVTFNVGELPTSNSQVGGKSGPLNVTMGSSKNPETINLNGKRYDKLYIAAAGANGDQTADIIINWAGKRKSPTTWEQEFSDWRNNGSSSAPTGVKGQEVIAEGYVVNQLGNITNDESWIYGYTFNLRGRKIDSITLPDNDNVGILGMTLV